MRPARSIFVCALLLSIFTFAQAQGKSGPAPHTTGGKTPVVSLTKLPLVFEPNVGQGPSSQAYMTRVGAMQFGFSANALNLRLPSANETQELGITLVDANKDAQITASDKKEGESNYLLGNESSAWKTHIPQYGRLVYGNIYPGVDLIFYGNGGRVEHDFVVQPGADYRQIAMRYQGARKLTLSNNGDLHVALSDSEVIIRAPHIYQTVDGQEEERHGSFVLISDDEVAFKVSTFDPALPLVIDPVLDYATYLANLSLYVAGAAVDAAGNTYIIGQTFSSSYPVTSGAVQKTCSSCPNQPDVFITKLNATGTAQVYSTLLGGSNYNQPTKIAVDNNGNAIVTGYTSSTDFPLKNPISSGTASSDDGFVTSLAPDGASLNFSSRLGGTSSQGTSASTFPGGVAVDTSGNVYVSGTTESSYLPVTSGAVNAGVPSYFSGNYVFLTKLLPAGGLTYSAILGATGSASECCSVVGVAVDSNGDAYVAGTVGVNIGTTTTPWPITAGAYQSTMIAPGDTAPFAAKVSADGSKLLYSTLVTTGIASSIALTSDGQVIFVGTANYNYPVTSNAFSSTVGTSFIARLSADGTQLPYSTYFSTPSGDTGGSITNVALDAAGDVWIAGSTGYSNNIPMVYPLQSLPGSGGLSSGSAFVSEFDPQIQHLLFSTYFNGTQGGTRIDGIAIDAQSHVHIAGTGQDDLPTTSSAYLISVTPPPPNQDYTYGFAAVIDPTQPGPGICFTGAASAVAQVGSSGQASFTISSCGSGPLNISNIQLSGTNFALSSDTGCIGALAAGASCSVTASFTPTIAGNYSGTVMITSNAMVTTYGITISGFATAPVISIQPSNLVFPAQVLGVSTSGSNLTVFAVNTGTAPLNVYGTQAAITGDFSIVSNDCGTPIPPSSEPNSYSACAFTIAFAPTALGTRTGTLTIASSDPVHPTVTVPISGTAIAAYTTPTITSLSVPSVAEGTKALKLYVYGTNFFPASYVVIGGESHATTYAGAGALQVSVDPSLLTVMGELPVSVVNPSPGGQSNSVTLLVFQALPISAASLVYDTATQMLYASIPSTATANANTVLPINPVTGALGTPIAVGNNPGKLAVSSDGAYLYVGLNTDHTLQRINLAIAQVERTFPLPIDSLTGTTTVDDMQGVPGSPQSVVVSLSRPASPSEAGAALFNDSGVVSFLGNTFQNKNYSVDNFTFTSNPSIFYEYPFNGNFFGETGVSPTALTIIAAPGGTCCNETTGSIVASDGTLLYTNTGQVWNPVTSTLVGTYSATSGSLFYEPDVLPDTANKRTFMLDDFAGYSGAGGYTDILSFDQTAYTQAGSVSIGLQQYDFVSDLKRWGADGFAFRSYFGTSSDEIVILRSSLTHTATGGTPTLSSLSPNSTAVGSATSQITVNGSGFIPGTTVLWNGAPLETIYVSATQLIALAPRSEFSSAGTAQVTAANPAPGGASSALSFTVLGPQVTLSSTSVNFGSLLIGTTSTATQITVTNTGGAPVNNLSLSLTGTDTSSFSETTTCTSSLVAGGNCTASLTFTPSTAGAKQATLTITDNAPNSPQGVSLSGSGTVPVPDFSVTASPSTLSIKQGSSGTAVLTVTPINGFSQATAFSCSGLPLGATCSFSPSTVTPSGSPATSTLTITTTPSSARTAAPILPWNHSDQGEIAFALLLSCGAIYRRRRFLSTAWLTLLCVSVLVGLAGCTSPSNNTTGSSGTPIGSYNLSIGVGVSGSTSHTAALSVTVTQ